MGWREWPYWFKGAIIGFIVGLVSGLGATFFFGFPLLGYYLFLLPLWDAMLPYGDVGEALGFLGFLFAAAVGSIYGVIIGLILKKFKSRSQ